MLDIDPKTLSQKIGKLGVLMGGNSLERAISLQSGQAVITALNHHHILAIAIDMQDNYIQQLQEQAIDTAFIALHGGDGENGKLQAVLETLGIAYTGSNMLSSALAMNKWLSKLLWRNMEVPTPPTCLLTADNHQQVITDLGLPLAIKPASQGSSLGISKVTDVDQLAKAYQIAKQYDDTIIAESWITGKELVVGILNNCPLPIIQITTDREFYDYTAKYDANTTQYLTHHGLTDDQVTVIQTLALNTFNSLACRHYGRVDLILDEQNKAWVIEVNTIPGMTDHSLLPMAAKAHGIDFNQLILQMLVGI